MLVQEKEYHKMKKNWEEKGWRQYFYVDERLWSAEYRHELKQDEKTERKGNSTLRG